MVDPKVFYRELDAFLAKIRIDRSHEDFLPFILSELERNFGERLHFGQGRLYERRGKEFVLIYPRTEAESREWAQRLDMESEVVRLAYKHRSYIYDNLPLNRAFRAGDEPYEKISVAILVHNPERQWLIVFQLEEGWVREEISLFLNAVRTSLNYRLFSEAMGGRFEQAVQIQKSLLPRKAPSVEGYQIFGHSEPAEFVGGDFYDYFQFDDVNFGVALGDASGHGFPAALLVRDVVIGLRMGLAREMRIVYTIEKLNQVIQRSTYSTNFVSLFVGEIEWDGHLFYVNAGHPAPFLVAGKEIHDLPATGITLGFMPEISLNRAYIHMEPGSTLVIYTDGIIERLDEKDQHFGIDRLKKLVKKNIDLSAEGLVNLIFNAVYDYGGRTQWEDDATVVVIKRVEK